MKNKDANTIEKVLYTISAVLYFITIIISYGDVSSNLDGWHGFSGNSALVFVIICLLMIGSNIYIIKESLNDKLKEKMKILMIVIPLIFHLVAVSLAGNVESDWQYLILRTFQGFDDTYIYLTVVAIAGYVISKIRK